MSELIKNIEHETIVTIKDLIDYQEGSVASLTMAKRQAAAMTLMAFDAGEGVSTHAAPGDAFVNVLEGEAHITIADKSYVVKAGEGIVMPSGVPHSVKAKDRFKMLLTVVKEQ